MRSFKLCSHPRVHWPLAVWIGLSALMLQACSVPGEVSPSQLSPSADSIQRQPSDDPLATLEAALDAALDTSSGEVIRRQAAGIGGFDSELVSRLSWGDSGGRFSFEFVADETYMRDDWVRDFVHAKNAELSDLSRDLDGVQLREVLDRSRSTISDLLVGLELRWVGLGWVEASTGSGPGAETLTALIVDGRLRRISRSVELLGTTGSDSWEFAG